MKNKNILLVFCLSVCLVSCIEHSKNETAPSGKSKAAAEEQKFIEEKSYKGFTIFTGKIPCADCSGIEQRLVLKGDTIGIYRLTEVYKDATEDGDVNLVSTGEWQFIDPKTKKEIVISQGHLGDSTRVATYLFENNKIIQTSLDGEKVQPKYLYTLRKAK